MNLSEKNLKELYRIREKNVKLIFNIKDLIRQIEEDEQITFDEKQHLLNTYNHTLTCAQELIKYHNILENAGELSEEEEVELRKLLARISDLDQLI